MRADFDIEPGERQTVEDALKAMKTLRHVSGENAKIAFTGDYTRQPEHWVNPEEFDHWIPALLDQTVGNYWCTLNTFKHLKGEIRRKKPYLAGLSSCYIDIDAGVKGKGYSAGQIVGVIVDEVNAGRMPAPSIFAYSGGGVWAIWRITIDGAPAEATPGVLNWWERIQEGIFKRFEPIGADAHDATRYTRLPGSINENYEGGRPVYWYTQNDATGQTPSYELSDLAEYFREELGVMAERLPLPATPKPTPKAQQHADAITPARAGELIPTPRLLDGRAYAPKRAVMADLVDLISMRGGKIRKGARQMFCLVWVKTLILGGVIERDVYRLTNELIERHFERTTKPWVDRSAEFIRRELAHFERLKRTRGGHAVKDDEPKIEPYPSGSTIASWLKVSDAEAELLRTVKPKHIRKAHAERRRVAKDKQHVLRIQDRRWRDDTIIGLYTRGRPGKRRPSLRAIAAEAQCSINTVKNVLRRRGLYRGRS